MKKLLMLTVALVAAGLVRADGITPIPSVNDVGFIDVQVPGASGYAILSVPFEKCLGEGSAGTLKALVPTNGLQSHADNPLLADQLIVLTTNEFGKVYFYYWNKTGAEWGWQTNFTVKLDQTGTNTFLSQDAATFPVARGSGFWIKRPASVSGTTLYMKGEIPTAGQSVAITNGLTLMGLGSLQEMYLTNSAITWGSRYYGSRLVQDRLRVVINSNGDYADYYFLDDTWKTGTLQPCTATVQPGCGFWYVRETDTDLGFTTVVP